MSSNNKRIAKNTVSLYVRSLVSLLIGLFTVRIVLKALGEEDYGLYTVVGGAIGFLTFVTGALSVGSQRFFSYAIGKGDQDEIKSNFNVTYTIYLILIAIIFVLTESVAVWIINTVIHLPDGRVFAPNVIFQIVFVSTCVSLASSPYMMAIMAHEYRHLFGKLSILGSSI